MDKGTGKGKGKGKGTGTCVWQRRMNASVSQKSVCHFRVPLERSKRVVGIRPTPYVAYSDESEAKISDH